MLRKGLLTLLLVLVAAVAQAQYHTAFTQMVGYCNYERARRGLPALQIDQRLMRGCDQHGRWMAANSRLQHASGVNEIIAMGQPNTWAAIQGWLKSPGHFRIMMGRYRTVGAAGFYDRNGRPYWVMRFQ